MTDQSEPTTTTIRYPSLGVLRAAHGELLKRRRAEGESPALWAEVARFVTEGRASGAVLDNDGERETAQSLLDYWSTLLFQAGQAETDATLHEFDPELAPELPNEPAPYVGLDAFHSPEFFFGRERLVAQMGEKLADVRLLAVVGPSGSGKSSAVLAGLVPALGRGVVPGSAGWRVLPRMVPGSHPLANLARLMEEESGTQINAGEEGLEGLIGEMQADSGTLTRLLTENERRIDREESAPIVPNQRSSASSPPAVLVVDQFEETFTLCTDEAERAAFVANLLGLAAAPGAPHRVVLTMRSDYESWVSRIPALQEAFDRGRVQVLPLSAEELRRAILEPAEMVGLRFQEGIVEALISEVLGEPAALPLLQFTLRALWDERRRNRITWDVYSRVGGGRTALARTADALYNDLIPEEQVTARRILLRLVRPGAGLEVTSGRVAVAELLATGEDPGRVQRVLDRLLAARLLKQSEGDVAADRQVEVAHEALVRNWPTLVEWLEVERENLRQRRRLTDAAERWQERGRDESLLWRGTQLAEAEGYSGRTPLETAFVQASRDAEAATARRAQRNKRLQLAGVSVTVLAIVAALSIFSIGQSQLVVQANSRATEQAAANAIIAVASTEQAIANVTIAAGSTAQAVANATIAVAATQQANVQATVALAATAEAAARITADKSAQQAAQAQATAEAAAERAKAGELAGQALAELDLDAKGSKALALLLARQAVLTTWRSEGKVTDAALFALNKSVRETSPWLMNLPRSRHSGPVWSAAFSPDGQRILTGSDDNTAKLWDAQTGAELLTLAGHAGSVLSVAWSPQGDRILTGSADNTAKLWDAQTGAELLTLAGHAGYVLSVAWSPQGDRILTGSDDKTAKVWLMPDALLEVALAKVQRDPPVFTPEERARYGIGE